MIVKNERIIEILVSLPGNREDGKVVIELFRRGNILLLDKDSHIMGRLDSATAERGLEVGKKYTLPSGQRDICDLDLEQWNRDMGEIGILTFLARKGVLGRVYAGEICKRAGISINKKAITEKERLVILEHIKKSGETRPDPRLYFEGKQIAAISPFPLGSLSSFDERKEKTLSAAVKAVDISDEPAMVSKTEGEIMRIKRIIEQQQDTIRELGKKADIAQRTGETIYKNYDFLQKGVENFLNIRKRLRGNEHIKELSEFGISKYDPRNRKISIIVQ
jgi:predicted ribosome quality control (RQC) complex YloA/Tae2 family protein